MPAETLERPASFADKMATDMKPLEAEKLAQSGQQQSDPAKAAPAAKPAEAAKPATQSFDDVDKEIEAGKRSPKSDDFKRVKTAATELRKKVDEYEPKIKTYETELAELKKAPKHNAELIKTITEERDRYKGMFEQVAVEISPEFHAKYKTRLDAVKAGLPSEHADKLMSLLQLPDSDVKRKHLAEITSEMDEFQVAEVVAANRDIRTILNERQGELTKAQESLSKIGEERTKKQQERQTALSKAFDDVITRSQDPKDGIPVFQTKEGDEAWNKGVIERLGVAKAIFSGIESDSERADAAMWAAAAPEFLTQLKAVTGELAEAKETINKLRGSTPPMDGGGAPAQGGKLSFGQLVSRDMKAGT